MSWLEAFRLALQQIRVQKLKSFFTLLGVTIGVMFLIAVVAVVEGMGQYMEHNLIGKLMAVHSFELRTFPEINVNDEDDATWTEYMHRPRITEDDLHPVTDALPPGTRWYMLSESRLMIQSQYAAPRQVGVNAVTGDWFNIKSMGVTSGRVFTQQELESGSLVVVVGADIKEHFFP